MGDNRHCVVVAEFVDRLNELLDSDPVATRLLFEIRVSFNPRPGTDPDVIVGDLPDGTMDLGWLGVLNGIIGNDSPTRIAAVWDDAGALIGFREIDAATVRLPR